MTKEEIKQKTSLCFLLNPNIPEEGKNCVIEKVMSTKATIVPKAALCNIITYILKQNAKLKSKNCWKTCEYAEPKSQWISQHIQQLAKAKEIIKKFSEFVNNEVEFGPEHPQEHTDLWNELCEKAEQFLRENE